MIFINKNTVQFILITISCLVLNYGQNESALETVKSVADRIIQDCRFEFELVKQELVLGVQVIDFEKQFGDANGFVYALSYIQSEKDTVVDFGISASENITIRINDRQIDFRRTDSPSIKEIAYGMINFYDTVNVKINKGNNKILIKSEFAAFSKTFLRHITADPEEESWLTFTSKIESNSAWLFAGQFLNQNEESPETIIKNYYMNNGKYISWSLPKENLLVQLIIDEDFVFKRDSYADWNYANGETVLSIFNLAEATGDEKYKKFATDWCDFIIQNTPYFRYQYNSLNALRGDYHRIFRKSMLDDAGAPVLPFAQLSLEEKNESYIEILHEMTDYIFNEQVRLENGTFCRPEPEEMTVWADDLFMSVPLLLRMGIITGEKKYFDDVVNQIKNFTQLLYNEEKGLYKHGWFNKTNETSIAFWGRANGWVMWALSETLLHLPKDYQGYSDIRNIYKKHVDGLIKYQNKTGMWHQVLNYPESYEETSCTAMFILGIARGVNNGWLNESYKKYALNGWDALSKKIEPEGIVHGICRGTGIGNNLEFYFNRPTLDNDPRGLGAVITAGIEVSKLLTD